LPSLLNERDALERALHEQGPSKTRLRTLHLISKRILRAIEHQHHHEQPVYFRLAVDQIRDDSTTCVVVMDFTAATLQDEAAHMLRDLIVCVISFDPLHSAYATQYVDLVADDHTEDISYVCAGWKSVLEQTRVFRKFTTALIFSDGPSAHFKSRYIVHCFGSLLPKHGLRPEVNFWYAKHGRGRCDAHASHVKGFLNRSFLKRKGQVLQHQQHHEVSQECQHCTELFQFDWYTFVSELQTAVQSTRAYFLSAIPPFPRSACSPTLGIFDAHQICFYPSGEKFFGARLFRRSGQLETQFAFYVLSLLDL
jgi:hypothetical protein